MNINTKDRRHTEIETADIYEMLNQGGELLYDGGEGMAAELGGVQICNISDIDILRKLHDRANDGSISLYCVHNENAAAFIKEKCGMHGINRCSQWVYTGESFDLRKSTADISSVHADELGIIAEHSGETKEYIAERIAAGCMHKLTLNGRLAGFIGMHEAGSIGMLQVLPEYRRVGIGRKLLEFAVNTQLERGSIPYMHVVDGNVASIALQQSIGAVKCIAPALWVY